MFSTKDIDDLINKESINMMKDGVMVVNTGRGKLIETKALIKGLKSKKFLENHVYIVKYCGWRAISLVGLNGRFSIDRFEKYDSKKYPDADLTYAKTITYLKSKKNVRFQYRTV